jgi:hypothetical protein
MLGTSTKGRKYLTIIEHIFYFIIPFSCQNLSSIHAFVLHTKGLQVDADLYTRTQNVGRMDLQTYSQTCQ